MKINKISDIGTFVKCYIRAYQIKQKIGFSMSDKLRIIADKIDALESFNVTYCRNSKVGRLDAFWHKRRYNEMKKKLKAELKCLHKNY